MSSALSAVRALRVRIRVICNNETRSPDNPAIPLQLLVPLLKPQPSLASLNIHPQSLEIASPIANLHPSLTLRLGHQLHLLTNLLHLHLRLQPPNPTLLRPLPSILQDALNISIRTVNIKLLHISNPSILERNVKPEQLLLRLGHRLVRHAQQPFERRVVVEEVFGLAVVIGAGVFGFDAEFVEREIVFTAGLLVKCTVRSCAGWRRTC
ncbi:hypothetical protein BJ508DRAFT_88970 [Ascobolus immersus RN42]|uniref:Uncharacterized protein n=1 Tax=Ascobolus immersus RN42 TaxID=1160509 RepID=A0A3N4I8S0_ASCIM|nr:hypothetical protein BJ508DRAFT_88970 [Ascobolus immersus RN42]